MDILNTVSLESNSQIKINFDGGDLSSDAGLSHEITVGELIDTIEYDYPNFHLSLDCFWCEIVSGKLVLKEHEAARWLDKENLYSVEWLPADVSLIEKIALKLQEE